MLLQNGNFLLLMSGFAIATGAVWALLLLEQQLVAPCGYSDETAGILGAALLGTGVVCAFAVGGVMERTKEYVLLQKGNMVLYALAVVGLYASNRPGNTVGLFVAWCSLGAVLEPLMPLTLEHAAEMSYPLPADSSTALLLVRRGRLRRCPWLVVSWTGLAPQCSAHTLLDPLPPADRRKHLRDGSHVPPDRAARGALFATALPQLSRPAPARIPPQPDLSRSRLSPQLPVSADCSSVFTPAAAVVCSLVVVGVVLTLFVRKDYRRQAAEHARNFADLSQELRDGLAAAHAEGGHHHAPAGGGPREPRGAGSGGAGSSSSGSRGGGGATGGGDDPTEPLLPHHGPGAGGGGGARR